MPDYQAITKTDFTDKNWQRCPNFLFVAGDAVCPLTAMELPKAMMYMPTCFIPADEGYALTALLGLRPGENLYVNPKGQWLGKYIPAAYRTYPFVLAKNEAEEGQQVLCFDRDSGLLESELADQSFFDDDGSLNSELNELMQSLAQINASREATLAICKLLEQHELLKPWELKIQLKEGVHGVEGLYCIDEEALNALPDETFIELRKAGVLALAYCQLLSMQRVSLFDQLLKAKARYDTSSDSVPEELNLDPIDEAGTLNFDNL